jgi:hypothetical protein
LASPRTRSGASASSGGEDDLLLNHPHICTLWSPDGRFVVCDRGGGVGVEAANIATAERTGPTPLTVVLDWR